MSGESKSASISGNLALDGSGSGLSIKGNADNAIAAKSDLKTDQDIVAATINLGNLDESDVRNILETLKPYEHNIKVLTKKDLSAGVGLDSIGLGLKNPTEGLLKSNLSLDSSADLPALSFNGLGGGLNAEPGVGGKITGPTLNGDLPKLSLNKPSADAGAAVTMPSLGLPGSDIKADIDGSLKTPNVSASAPQVKIPNASLKVDKPDLKLGECQAPQLKMPNIKFPKTEMDVSGDLDLPSVSGKVDAPNLNLSTPKSGFSGGLNAEPGVSGKITGPSLNGDLPKLSLNKPSAGAAVTIPSIGLTGSDVKADIDGSLKTPDVRVSAPQVKIPNAPLKVDKPDLKSGECHTPKFKMPDFKLPKTELPKAEMDVSGDLDLPSVSGKVDTPNLNVSTPKTHFKKPNLELNEPKLNLNDPDLKLEAPNADIEVPSGKIKWPHLKWKSAKVKGPDADLDAEIPDASLSMAKVGGNLDVDTDFPKADIKGPQVDVKTPDLDLNSPSGKINWPHMKWKKPKFHGSKDSLDIDANIEPADVNLSLPKVKGELDRPDVDINLPKADIKGPDLDVQTPEIDVESTSGKINWPHMKWKKPKFHGSKDNLDIDANIEPADVNLSLPKVKGELDRPDVDINLPKADIKGPDLDMQTPEIDVESTSGKINWPHLKWKKPKAQGLAVDGDLNTPDVNLTSPKIEGDINVPKAELAAPDVDAPSGKINWPHRRWKRHKVHGPKAEVDGDWNTPDVNLSTPKIDGKINSPDIDLNLPKANVDIDKPEMDIDPPSGKIKWPTLKKPKWGISNPKVNGPDVDLDADLSGPNLDLSAPKIDGKINSPDIDLNLPKADVDIEKPDLDIDSPSGKIKWPTFKKPKWGISNPKVKGPEVDLDADLSGPNLDLSAPKIDGKINSPDFDLNLPKADVDIEKPYMDIDSPSGKIKWPTFKKPKWGISNPKVNGPEVDLDADLSGPNLDLSAPKIDGKINSPDINLNLPKADVDIEKPDLDIDSPSGKIKWPTFKKPKWGISNPKVNGPEVDLDADLSGPNLDLSTPKIDGEIHTPDLNLKAPKTQLQGQKLDLNARLPNSELEAPDVTIKSQNLEANPPKLALKAYDGQIKAPDIELDPRVGDFKLPNFKVPALDLSSPNAETLNVHAKGKAGIEAPKVNLSNPAADASISAPALELNGPKVEGPKVDINAPDVDADVEKFRIPHFKIPKFSFLESKLKTGEANASEDGDDDDDDTSNIETDVPMFRLHTLPKSVIDGLSDFSDPFGLSKRDNEEQDFVVRKGIKLPVSNTTAATGKVDIMQILKLSKEKSASVLQTEDANLRLAAPSLDVSASAEAEDSSLGTLKIEKPGYAEGSEDENQRLSQSLANMLCLGSDDGDAV